LHLYFFTYIFSSFLVKPNILFTGTTRPFSRRFKIIIYDIFDNHVWLSHYFTNFSFENTIFLLCSRFKLRMCGLQVDNQLPLTPMPVLFRPQRVVSETDYILKFSITMQSNGSLDLCVYPYIGLHVSISILKLLQYLAKRYVNSKLVYGL
jgi:hypothetical protein